jgi:hypothetical protein
MTRYFKLTPGSCGVLGENTVFERTIISFEMTRLHVLFQFGANDAILRVAGNLLISVSAAAMLADIEATGFAIEAIEVGVDEQIAMLGAWKGSNISRYRWLKVCGIAGVDDFGRNQHRLIVSERALEVLKRDGLSQCEVAECVWFN